MNNDDELLGDEAVLAVSLAESEAEAGDRGVAGSAPAEQRPMKRTIHFSTAADLVIALPRLLTSYVIIQVIGFYLGQTFEPWVWLLPLLWLGSAAIVFVPATENLIARLLMRMREPTGSERAVLEPLWKNVCARAGQDPDKYRLWMEDTDQVNASASSGHNVAVTRGALGTLPASQLEAVLAHELGHHIGGHAWSLMVIFWLTIPNRIATTVGLFAFRIYKWIWAVSAIIAAKMRGIMGFIWVAVVGVIIPLAVLWTMLMFMPWLVLLLVTPVLSAYAGRRQEHAADRVATDLGYGSELIATFEDWRADGSDDEARQLPMMARLLGSHPLLARRILAIEKRLSSQ